MLGVNSVSDIPESAAQAYWEWVDGEGTEGEFVQSAGGVENARIIQRLLHPQRREEAERLIDEPEQHSTAKFQSRPKSPYKSRQAEGQSTETTPPVLALFLSIGIAMVMIVKDEYQALGIILIAPALGFHLLSLIWLEVFTMSSFRRRPAVRWSWLSWSCILGVSILSSSFIGFTSILATSDLAEFSLIFDRPTALAWIPGSLTFKICLLFQIISNVMLISSLKGFERLPSKWIRSPWTIPSVTSLISLTLLIFFEEYNWSNDVLLATFGTFIIGSSAHVYGRSANSSLLMTSFCVILPSFLGLLIITQPGFEFEFRDSTTALTYIALPLFLNVMTWVIPKDSSELSSEGFDDTGPHLMMSNAFLFFIAIACVYLVVLQSERWFIPVIPAIFSYAIYSREHTNKLGGDVIKVNRIINRYGTGTKSYRKVRLNFSILGAVETGKTSFTTALWTLLTSRDIRNIWWSKWIDFEDHQILRDHGHNLDDLAARGSCETVAEMLEERIAIKTCNHWINQREFPSPGTETPFPFSAQSFGTSERELNELKALIVSRENRGLPAETTVAGKVSIVVSFHADVDIISPSFFWKRALQNKRESCEIELMIETWDIAGESFAAAITHTRELMNSSNSRNYQWIRKGINRKELNQLGHMNADPGQVQAARDLFLQSSHTFLIVDLEDLIDGGDGKKVTEYLRLMQKIHREGDGRLETLQILLNKADILFGPKDDKSILSGWWEVGDRRKAEEILNDATNYALDDLRASGLEVGVSFMCAFGGIVPELDEYDKPIMKSDGKHSMLAPYPMIPVNIIEPLIDVILSSRLYCEDI
jgi:hypothetical protein